MRRFSWRELTFLMAAPLCLLGLGIWGPQLREQWWPTQPRIECEVRPPTPLEISQGAQVGVTVRAIIPKLKSCPFSRFHIVNASDSPVWVEEHTVGHSNYIKSESHQAYSWNPLAPVQQPLIAKCNLSTQCGGFQTLKQQCRLTAKDIAPPDPIAARRTNFRVTKAVLEYMEMNGIPSGQQCIWLHVEDVFDERQGLLTLPKCVGKWVWQDGESHSVRASATGSATGTSPKISQVRIAVDTTGVQVPPPKGTKISGLLSINHGWPQEITMEWPDKLTENFAQTEMKFSTKLAPLPTSVPASKTANSHGSS